MDQVQQIRKIGKKRAEIVWEQGSPLSTVYTSLVCDMCSKDSKEATCMSIGYGWRAGWVFLCKDCHLSLNYWQEDEEKLNKSYEHFLVKVSQQ